MTNQEPSKREGCNAGKAGGGFKHRLPKSVSRWENNAALPGTTLVVPLANFIGVITEIDWADAKKENAVRKFDKKSQALKTDGLIRENDMLWQAAAQIYLDDFHVLEELFTLWFAAQQLQSVSGL